MTTPTPRPFYIVEPHSSWVKEGEIDITEIVTRVYGKPFDAVRSMQQYEEDLSNDSVCLVELAKDEDYEEVLWEADQTELYLGLDDQQEEVYHRGHTTIQYWQSVGWAGLNGLTEADVTVTDFAPRVVDYYGAVFATEHRAQQYTSPPIDHVLADLIRRGELPRGDFIARHWW